MERKPREVSRMQKSSPRVGVGVIVLRDGLVLLGQRLGSHGAGTWALPGGHLEYGESVEQCAIREVEEETGLRLTEVIPGPYVNNVFVLEEEHYVTLVVLATTFQDEPVVREPTKCASWGWFEWTDLPTPLFAPLEALRRTGFVPIEAGASDTYWGQNGIAKQRRQI